MRDTNNIGRGLEVGEAYANSIFVPTHVYIKALDILGEETYVHVKLEDVKKLRKALKKYQQN